MLDSLEREGVRQGATKAFVRDLLGQPDQTDDTRDYYFTGPPQHIVLVISYDARGVVARVAYVSHLVRRQ
jgi:hypothetical protein